MPITTNYAQGALTTSSADLFTASGSTTINLIRLVNIDGSNVADATVSRVPTGGGTSRALASTQTVPADAALRIDGPIYLNSGDKITGLASANGDIAYHIEYVVRS